MAILFAGGELEDFTGTGQFQYSGSNLRAAYARVSLAINGGTFAQNSLRASFAANSTLAVSARVYFGSFGSSSVFMWLADGTAPRLRLRVGAASPSVLTLESWNGSAATTLATSTLTIVQATGPQKFDLLVTYGGAGVGRVQVYVDQTLYIDTGLMDVAAGGGTTLSSLYLGSATNGNWAYWSEIIVTDGEDTRPLSLKTLAPNATGDVTGWTSGTWADFDETTASDSDLAISEAANQVLSVNCTGMPTGASGLAVRAVKSVALAARGATGPSRLALGVRQSATNSFAASQPLDTGYGATSTMWTTNPVTSAPFTATEIENLQLAYRSEA